MGLGNPPAHSGPVQRWRVRNAHAVAGSKWCARFHPPVLLEGKLYACPSTIERQRLVPAQISQKTVKCLIIRACGRLQARLGTLRPAWLLVGELPRVGVSPLNSRGRDVTLVQYPHCIFHTLPFLLSLKLVEDIFQKIIKTKERARRRRVAAAPALPPQHGGPSHRPGMSWRR